MIRLTIRWLCLLLGTIGFVVPTYFYITYDSNNPSTFVLETCRGAVGTAPKIPPSEMFPELYENAVINHLFPDEGWVVPSIERCIEETLPDMLLHAIIGGTFFFICIFFFIFIELKKPGTF